jgi:hypothetical protein
MENKCELPTLPLLSTSLPTTELITRKSDPSWASLPVPGQAMRIADKKFGHAETCRLQLYKGQVIMAHRQAIKQEGVGWLCRNHTRVIGSRKWRTLSFLLARELPADRCVPWRSQHISCATSTTSPINTLSLKDTFLINASIRKAEKTSESSVSFQKRQPT